MNTLHIDGLPNYQTLPGLRASMLKAARVSLKHLRHYLDNPPEQTAAMAEGIAFDSLLLGGPERVAWAVKLDKRTKAGKEAWAEFQAEYAGMTIVPVERRDALSRMADAVRNHPFAGALVAKSAHHAVALWEDHDTGQECKAECDCLGDPFGIAPWECDIKRTAHIAPHDMARQAYNMGWLHQRAWYRWGLAECDVMLESQYLVAVEPEPPHDVAVYAVEPSALDELDEEIRALVRAIHEAKQTGHWPGIDGDRAALPLGLPSWRKSRGADRAATLDLVMG